MTAQPGNERRPRRARLLLACTALMAAILPFHTSAAELPLLPAPAQIQLAPGQLTINTSTPVVTEGNDKAAQRVADYLCSLLRSSGSLALHVEKAKAHTAIPVIQLRLDPASPVTQPEGYDLAINEHGVQISAREEAGLFYGAVSLWQLLSAAPSNADGSIKLTAAEIHDWPRVHWRGVMLDSARHFQDVATIKRLIDAMAQHKLNVLHWHLTDDQGWRLQILRYPALTQVGAWRTPPAAGHDGEPARYGGFYTQQQIRDVVAYAAARHINIVPELDMPGHAQAAAVAYPQHVGGGAAPVVATSWGIHDYLYGVEEPDLAFVRSILDEVLALFPSRYIHVGGDEALKYRWQASAKVQARMRQLGVGNEDQLQAWFIGQVGNYLKAHGRRLIGWDEILLGGLPDDATVMSWHGIDGAIQAAKMGHDAVLAPSPQLYFDNLQSGRADEPAGRLKIQTLADVYAFDPLPATLDQAAAKHILGAQAELWTEYLVAPWQIDHALYPRIDALSEALWSPESARDWNGFLQRLVPQFKRYRKLGIDFADSAFAVDAIAQKPNQTSPSNSSTITVKLGNQANYGIVRYTLDGSTPSVNASRYTAALSLPLGSRLSAATFADDGTPLSTARTIKIDNTWLYTRDSGQLRPCRDNGLRLRLPLLPDLDRHDTPVYDVDLFDACWIYPQAATAGASHLHVEMARLPRNFSLTRPQLASRAVHAPPATGNQLQVHANNCQGPLLASLPMPASDSLGKRFVLDTQLPAIKQSTDVCLIAATPLDGPLYAIGSVLIEPATPPPSR